MSRRRMTVEGIRRAISYRSPMRVTQTYRWSNGLQFPVCPRCLVTIEREYMSYCDRCGQALNWDRFARATVIEKS